MERILSKTARNINCRQRIYALKREKQESILRHTDKMRFDGESKFMEYLFAVLIPIVAVAIVVILAKRIASHSFKCKHCSKEFNIKWSKVVITEHSGNEYLLVCPYCKTKDWCTEQPTK